MYAIGDLIYYGQLGVCRVGGIGVPAFLANDPGAPLYYTLEPIQKQGSVFVPVDGDAFIRPLMDRSEALALIDRMPTISNSVRGGKNLQGIAQAYSEKMRSHNVDDLVSLILAINEKKKQRAAVNRRIGNIDESYLKRAESLLFGELACALGIEESAVPGFITDRLTLH
ncbi:MAG: CarD family transcriptional regulator [Clostridia bacterium]|nr:CarD family transcriptional regulator [Clostridia bacterium]